MEIIYFKNDTNDMPWKFTNGVNVISRLKQLYENNHKIKIWCHCDSGIGDCFAHINAVLFFCCTCCNIPVDNITFSLIQYTNIEKYILSERVKILSYEKCLQLQFDVCIPTHHPLLWSLYQLHLSHDNHFSKFFTYSKSISEQTSIYSNLTCIYLRFYKAETEQKSVEKMINQFMNAFLDHWNSSEQYIICSPHPVIDNQFWPSNVILSTQINNRKINIPQYDSKERSNNTEIAVLDMAIISNSKKAIIFKNDAAISRFFGCGRHLSVHNKPVLYQRTIEENLQAFKTGQYHRTPKLWQNVMFI